MKTFHFMVLGTLALSAGALVTPRVTSKARPGTQAGGTPTKPTVYVSEFELDVLPAAAPQSEETRKFAAHLVDGLAQNLVRAFQKAGYTAVRLRSGDSR